MGHILEQIAELHPEVMFPVVKKAQLGFTKHSKKSTLQVSTETRYLLDEFAAASTSGHSLEFNGQTEEEKKDRSADIQIALFDNDFFTCRIVVEIKMNDKFHEGQLQDYIDWAARRKSHDDRAIVVLTAYPLDVESQKIIDSNEELIQHMYLSDLIEGVKKLNIKSELIDIFSNYLTEEGYAMYQLNSNSGESDFNALRSFMVLSFLPHESGHGRVATSKNIARGPLVFSNLIQNWQLVSERLASDLGFTRIPTIRYFPEQATKEMMSEIVLPEMHVLEARINARSRKTWGRYWLCSECVLPEENLRIEWGQILQIKSGHDSDDSEPAVDCTLYALLRRGKIQEPGAKTKTLDGGVENVALYSPDLFMAEIKKCIDLKWLASLKGGRAKP